MSKGRDTSGLSPKSRHFVNVGAGFRISGFGFRVLGFMVEGLTDKFSNMKEPQH